MVSLKDRPGLYTYHQPCDVGQLGMFNIIIFLVSNAISEKFIKVGLETKGLIDNIPVIGPETIWTEEGSFTFKHKVASEIFQPTDSYILSLFGKQPGSSKVLFKKKEYFLSGPVKIGPTLSCRKDERCSIEASWANQTGWDVKLIPQVDPLSTTPTAHRAFVLRIKLIGPITLNLGFNSINWRISATLQTTSFIGRYPESKVEKLTKIIPITLSQDRPNGIIGIM